MDKEISGLDIEYVLLKKDSVWNMLKKIAVYARAYVYTDRNGVIHMDKADTNTEKSGVEITPDNSFSYNLPDFSRTVVNRVEVEYSELVEGEEEEIKDDTFTLDSSKCEAVKNENGVVTHYIAELKLKNFYEVISKEMIKRCDKEFNNNINYDFEFDIIES
ncbi:MAG: hypothetical protein FWH03_08045 [Firmicutes bacterium]|nr:hypothetical protein [Bacillota bacterium]